jgi:transitional endoplasmic reticulum ATPase
MGALWWNTSCKLPSSNRKPEANQEEDSISLPARGGSMRFRGHSDSAAMPMDKSQRFMMGRVLIYMDRLLTRFHRLDHEILEIIHWLVGSEIADEDLAPLATMLESGDRRRRSIPDLDEIRHEIRSHRDFANFMETCLQKARRDEHTSVIELLKGLLKKRLDQLQYSGASDIEKSLSTLQQMFDLSELEKELCLFLFIVSTYDEVQNLFQYNLHCDSFSGRNYLAVILGANSSEIGEAIGGKLSKIGILDSGRHGSLSMDTGFVTLIQNQYGGDIKTEFFRRIDPDPVAIDAHMVEPEVIDHILNLLKNKPIGSTHIIFYGPPGTGKTSLAYGIGKALGLPIYLVDHGAKERSWKRQAAITASVNMASQGSGALVIADDADNIVGTRNSWFFSGETSDKRWLHDVLETPGVRMIWTVNSIDRIEESVARRFSYSLAFKPFSRVQRKRIWETILTEYRLDSFFQGRELDHLASRFNVSAGVIEQAVKKAAEIGSDSEDNVQKAVLLSLEAYQSLTNGGRKPVITGKINPESFSIEGLNLSGVELSTLLKHLESFDDYLK